MPTCLCSRSDRREAKPLRCFPVILRHFLAVAVRRPKEGLGKAADRLFESAETGSRGRILQGCNPGVTPPENKKGLHRCKPLNSLVVMGGIEPPTYGL